MAPNVLFLFFRNQEMREITNHLRKAGIKLNHLNAMKSRNTDGIQTKYKKGNSRTMQDSIVTKSRGKYLSVLIRGFGMQLFLFTAMSKIIILTPTFSQCS